MKKFFLVLSIICSILGIAVVFMGMSENAVQGCECMLMGIAFAIIPYCLANAVSKF